MYVDPGIMDMLQECYVHHDPLHMLYALKLVTDNLEYAARTFVGYDRAWRVWCLMSDDERQHIISVMHELECYDTVTDGGLDDNTDA